MRTTVDLPPAVRARVQELAELRGASLSAMIAELTSRGLAQFDEPLTLTTDPRSGFPVVSVGRRITDRDVAAAIDEE